MPLKTFRSLYKLTYDSKHSTPLFQFLGHHISIKKARRLIRESNIVGLVSFISEDNCIYWWNEYSKLWMYDSKIKIMEK